MILPTIGKGTVQSLGRGRPSDVVVDTSGATLGKLVSSLAGIHQKYVDNKNIENNKNLGIELSKRLSSARLKMSETENVSKDMLSSIGVHDFDTDARNEIPTYEVAPFVNKSIIDNFARENSGSFSNENIGASWAKELTMKGLQQFGTDLEKVNKIVKKNQIASLESDIGIAQDQGDFNLSSSLINLLPKTLQKDYNHDNSIKHEMSGLNNQMARGTDEQLKSSLGYLQSTEYEGNLPADESMSYIKQLRAELTKRSSIREGKKKSEDIVISRAIKEMSKSIKKGDQNSFEALDKFSTTIDYESLSEKQILDLKKVNALRHNIEDLRAISSSTDRVDYISKMCKSGDDNCNDIKSIHERDLKMMRTDPMQYAMNAKITGIEVIDFENDSDVEIASKLVDRIKSKESITQYIGHESSLVTNNEAEQLNNKLKNMEPTERVSYISSTLELVGDESFLMLSEQVSGKINSNYYIAKSLMFGESENAIAISKGKSLQKFVPTELKNNIKAIVTQKLIGRVEFVDSAIDAVTSLIAYQINEDGDWKDASIEKKDAFYFEDDVDTVEEYIEQVIGRKENIHGATITLPNLKITNLEMQYTLNNIDPDSLDVPFSLDITQEDVASGLSSSSVIDFFSDSKYILKDSSIPGTWFVVDRVTGIPIRGQNNKAYTYKFDEVTQITTEFEKDKKLLDKLGGQL